MAFNFVPKSVSEITKNKKLGTYRGTMSALFQLLREKDATVKDPIAIDVEKGSVKVLPSFEKKISLATIKKRVDPKLKVTFGRGSRGVATKSSGKMVPGKKKDEDGGNKGIIFEKKFVADLEKFQSGDTILDRENKIAIQEITELYSLGAKDTKIVPEGALNKKRPLVFQGSNIYVGGADFDIGATVTDITLESVNPKTKLKSNVYLSLKWGNTVTFFNAGIQKILTKAEIKTGNISNANGKKILELFGIRPEKFCAVFNAYDAGATVESEKEDTFSQVNLSLLQNLIKSGVGYGYHLVHQANNGKIHHVKMTAAELETSSTPQSCMVYYGGLTGGGKRIDIVVETPLFTLKFNFRSKFRGIVYPTHLMCDYVIKH
jgi:hypothetical protein